VQQRRIEDDASTANGPGWQKTPGEQDRSQLSSVDADVRSQDIQ
jgi:hypothetical protein